LYFKNATEANRILIREKVKLKKLQNCSKDTISNDKSFYSSQISCNSADTCARLGEMALNLVSRIKPSRVLAGFGYVDSSAYKLFQSSTFFPLISIQGNQLAICDSSNSSANDSIDFCLLIKNHSTSTGIDKNGMIKLDSIIFTMSLQYFTWDGAPNPVTVSLNDTGTVYTLLYGNVPIRAKYKIVSKVAENVRIRYFIDLNDTYNSTALRNSNPNLQNSQVINNFNLNATPKTYTYLLINEVIGVSLKNFRLRDCCDSTDLLQLRDDSLFNGVYTLSAIFDYDIKFKDICQLMNDSVITNKFGDNNQFNQYENYT
jgi:hypothetical protein